MNVNPADELPATWCTRVNEQTPSLQSLSWHCCGLVRRVRYSTAFSHTMSGVIKWIQLPDQDRGEGKSFSHSRNIYCRNWKHLLAENSYKPGFTVWERWEGTESSGNNRNSRRRRCKANIKLGRWKKEMATSYKKIVILYCHVLAHCGIRQHRHTRKGT